MIPQTVFYLELRPYSMVTMAMDRGNREKEAAAVLLSAMYPVHVRFPPNHPPMTKCCKPLRGLATVTAKSSKWIVLIGRTGQLSTLSC